MDYLCSIKIDVLGWTSVKIKNQLVRAIESSSKIRQYQVEFVRRGRFTLPQIRRRTKKEVIEIFIHKQIIKCYREFARIHRIEKKNIPKTSKYKEKKGSYITELLLTLPSDITGGLVVAFLTYLASLLKKEFEKLIIEKPPKKGKEKSNKDEENPANEKEEKTKVQVKIGKLIAEDVIIIITE